MSPEWVHDGVEATRTSDALLDRISELVKKRDHAISSLHALRRAYPEINDLLELVIRELK